ncbi:CoF synthetase [Saccharolobus solfataricus]|uniref:CoF synthetase n=2 Tax=Saccharolobus solfataricus TaxID=2287 RepID=A0A0E3MF61_SACSO|nr:adenosylcobinamide amidohydrolase [Saccharolobus solfataricus]AKA74586.1 CoF synthetase [Saccharolobus solfataricus]AKA77282.1 CoF synthetase [Saccharolobus solfataricus]AKA79974.1 CoF synthetase [Saccharolobus solfataricus]AZF69056.1 CoF synthetase [Saccharolobus solfataricus]AZF71676.1 CoF synthetase [Saccharolobus solfataricus]
MQPKILRFDLKRSYITLTSALNPEGIVSVNQICSIFVDKSYCTDNPWKDVVDWCPSKTAVVFMTAAKNYAFKETDWGKFFISAGIGESGEDAGCTINIGVFVNKGLNVNGLVDLIRTITEAKSGALRDLGYKFTGTVSDAVAVGSLLGSEYFIGPGTELGKRIAHDVRSTIVELLSKDQD